MQGLSATTDGCPWWDGVLLPLYTGLLLGPQPFHPKYERSRRLIFSSVYLVMYLIHGSLSPLSVERSFTRIILFVACIASRSAQLRFLPLTSSQQSALESLMRLVCCTTLHEPVRVFRLSLTSPTTSSSLSPAQSSLSSSSPRRRKVHLLVLDACMILMHEY